MRGPDEIVRSSAVTSGNPGMPIVTSIASPTRRQILAAPAVLALAGAVPALGYPTRPVTLIVPYAAGGTADILARIVAEGLGPLLGQSVVVENKPGASGTIGCHAVAKADADGQTLLFTAGGPLTVGPHLSRSVPYRTDADFTPIGLVTEVPSFLVVNDRSRFRTAAELIAEGRAKPGSLRFASPGVGTSVHLLAELFRLQAGFEAQHIPYRGGAPAVNDLMGGHVDYLFENVPQLLPQVSGRSLRALAVTAPRRLAPAPEVPTLEEAGIANVGVGTWYGLLGPAGLPAEIVDKLAAALAQAVATEASGKRLADLAVEADVVPGQRFRRFLADDSARWQATIERARITLAN